MFVSQNFRPGTNTLAYFPGISAAKKRVLWRRHQGEELLQPVLDVLVAAEREEHAEELVMEVIKLCTPLSLNAVAKYAGNTKGGSITVPLTSCLTGLESAIRQLTIFVLICKTDYSKTSQTGGQWYSDTSPFSIPWPTGSIFSLA